MADIVLVHGAWHGSWCWRRVLPLLWLAGHRVVPVTLSGLGERAHRLSPEITLTTHVDDVVTAMRAEECSDAVLVGHSYGGLVITGAAGWLGQNLVREVAPQRSAVRCLVRTDEEAGTETVSEAGEEE